MKPHLYYALKHFCNSELVYDSNYGFGFWNTSDQICNYVIKPHNMRVIEYQQKFTYHYKTLDRPLSVIDNYHTQKIYEWLIKR